MEVGPNRTFGSTGDQPERSEESHRNSISSKRLNEVNIKHSFSPNDVILASSACSVTSAEASGPPSPREGPIPNFGAIDMDKGIYRSSFPHSCNIEHLRSLKLKTLVTLVSTTFESDVEQWLVSSNVQHYRIKIPAHKSSDDTIPMEAVGQVMKLMTDETKCPILIHCNKGKHRTGCMTACFRKLQGMDDVRAITEYHEYAQPKARAYDVAFISKTRTREISDAVSNLNGPIEPICQHHIHCTSNLLGRISAIEKEKAGSIDGERPYNTDDSEGSDLQLQRFSTGRPIAAPKPPLSPPFSAAVDLGFSASELVDALSRIEDGRNKAALTPPQTPSEEYDSESSK